MQIKKVDSKADLKTFIEFPLSILPIRSELGTPAERRGYWTI